MLGNIRDNLFYVFCMIINLWSKRIIVVNHNMVYYLLLYTYWIISLDYPWNIIHISRCARNQPIRACVEHNRPIRGVQAWSRGISVAWDPTLDCTVPKKNIHNGPKMEQTSEWATSRVSRNWLTPFEKTDDEVYVQTCNINLSRNEMLLSLFRHISIGRKPKVSILLPYFYYNLAVWSLNF